MKEIAELQVAGVQADLFSALQRSRVDISRQNIHEAKKMAHKV